MKDSILDIDTNRLLTYYEETDTGLCSLGLIFILDNDTNKFQCFLPNKNIVISNNININTKTLNYCINLDSDMSKIFLDLKRADLFKYCTRLKGNNSINYVHNDLGIKKTIIPIDIPIKDLPINYSVFLTYATVNIYNSYSHFGEVFVDVDNNSLVTLKNRIIQDLRSQFLEDILESILNQSENYSEIFHKYTSFKNHNLIWHSFQTLFK